MEEEEEQEEEDEEDEVDEVEGEKKDEEGPHGPVGQPPKNIQILKVSTHFLFTPFLLFMSWIFKAPG